MARYDLDDPRLQQIIEEMAAKAAQEWPAPSPEQLAKLAPLLRPTPPRKPWVALDRQPTTPRTVTIQTQRAA